MTNNNVTPIINTLYLGDLPDVLNLLEHCHPRQGATTEQQLRLAVINLIGKVIKLQADVDALRSYIQQLPH